MEDFDIVKANFENIQPSITDAVLVGQVLEASFIIDVVIVVDESSTSFLTLCVDCLEEVLVPNRIHVEEDREIPETGNVIASKRTGIKINKEENRIENALNVEGVSISLNANLASQI